ncbi:MAG: hypothetical protein EXS40_09440 [Opitutaceae bacterium]|nr:hypothetical protein [Opitutaceae bacterium]
MSLTRPFSSTTLSVLFSIALISSLTPVLVAADATATETLTQWRGPSRDGKVAGSTWPAKLSEDTLKPT